MSRSVPTLLGVMILLMVVMLVVLIYDFKLTSELATGGAVVGTVGGQLLTGVEQSEEAISASEALGRQGTKSKPLPPTGARKAPAKTQKMMGRAEQRSRRGQMARRDNGRGPGGGEKQEAGEQSR